MGWVLYGRNSFSLDIPFRSVVFSKQGARMTFEEMWENMAMVFANPTDEIMVKNVARKVYEAATKAALGSRVVGPSDESVTSWVDSYVEKYKVLPGSDCIIQFIRDNIKLAPLSVDEILPSEDEITKESDDHYVTLEGRMVYFDKAFRHGVNFIRESIKKRLGGL
jgi:hypothetical protein